MSRTEEQLALIDILDGLLAKRADSDAVRAAQGADLGYDADLWARLGEEIGVAALMVPEAYDGAGASIAETAAVIERLAQGLVPSPLLGTTLASAAVMLWGEADAQARLLPRLAAGSAGTIGWSDFAGGLVLNPHAEHVLAVDGDRLLLVEGAEMEALPTMDQGLRLGRLRGGVQTQIGAGFDAETLTALGRVLIAAAQTGLSSRALEMTVAYAGQRVQFDRAIGSFQAIKHRLADVLVKVEGSRSASWAAASAAAAFMADPSLARQRALLRAARVASAYCSEAATLAAAEAVQLHGGIAITWEHEAHLVFKTAHSLGVLAGQPHQVRAELAR